MPNQDIFSDTIKTPYGVFGLAASKRGVVRIEFPGRRRHTPNIRRAPKPARAILRNLKAFLASYFSGRPFQRKRIPLDPLRLSRFEQAVFRKLQMVGPGALVSYGELAKRGGAPRAARAVGNALRRNPIPILIPCHRVIRKDSSLGGYRHGLTWKKQLLQLDKRIQRNGTRPGKNNRHFR